MNNSEKIKLEKDVPKQEVDFKFLKIESDSN